MSLRQTINKRSVTGGRVCDALILFGIVLLLYGTVNVAFMMGCRRIHAILEEKGIGYITLFADMMTIADGVVEPSWGADRVKIAYYYQWDGIICYRPMSCKDPDALRDAEILVIYLVGEAPGSCRVVGLFRSRWIGCIAAGAVMVALGTAGKRMEDKNGKEKDSSRQLEDEHDTQ